VLLNAVTPTTILSLPSFYGTVAYNTNMDNKPYGGMAHGKQYGHKTYDMQYFPVYIQAPKVIRKIICVSVAINNHCFQLNLLSEIIRLIITNACIEIRSCPYIGAGSNLTTGA